MATLPITLWQADGETVLTMTDILSWGSKISVDGDCSHEIMGPDATIFIF